MYFGTALRHLCEFRSGAAITIDDTVRQQIVNFGARFRPVGAKKGVEADILFDHDD